MILVIYLPYETAPSSHNKLILIKKFFLIQKIKN